MNASATPALASGIEALLTGYRRGNLSVRKVIGEVMTAVRAEDPLNVWISTVSDAWLEPLLMQLEQADPQSLPLFGVPFAIKDNIDLAGVETTAGCPEFGYVPDSHAFIVARLIEAGAVPVGKTNLDQFATGLVGTRSPFGPCHNPFNPDYISGGSSAGSAVAVSLGLVSFALGTDTAGSGRVPAAFNNVVGLKPSCGLISTSGIVPACRSLDVVTVFAGSCGDAATVAAVATAFDDNDPYARHDTLPTVGPVSIPSDRFRVGVPESSQLEFFGNDGARELFTTSLERLRGLGAELVTVDFGPFMRCARLLYEGPWLAERYAAVGGFVERRPGATLPITRSIIGAGAAPSAVDAFNGLYALQTLKRETALLWEQIDLMVTPTAGTIYRIDEVESDPIERNSHLGYYTNFMNLLDLCAVAVPGGFLPEGLPFGVTLCAPAFQDQDLLSVGDRLHRAAGLPSGATGDPLAAQRMLTARQDRTVRVAVCGAHMSGLPLNWQLTSRNARLLRTTRSTPEYRFYALPGGPPFRPGMVRVDNGGGAIEVEIWEMPVHHFGSFVADIPAPLAIGRVRLEDGSEVSGFVCESSATAKAEDITALGSWRRYLARESSS